MNKPRVYLAGPISATSYRDATTWRKEAARALAEFGIDAYSPLRTKEFLKGKRDLTWEPNKWNDPMATSKGIQCRDMNDCINADALLVNFKGTTKASIGTCFEIAWAHYLRIPVIVIAEAENLHVIHPMATEMIDFRVDELDTAIELVKTVLLPEAV